ncbi:MAG: NUDIX hydrolase [bacterium]|nr:NUDIX hydrolase [bacterium]
MDNKKRTINKDVVLHPGAAVIVPLLDSGEVVLIKNQRLALDLSLWEFPAGTVKDGEEPHDCAARELEEETGFSAGKIYHIGELFTSGGWTTHRLFVFLARGLTETGQHTDEGEFIKEVRRFTLKDLDERVRSGDIVDAKTIAALVLFRNWQDHPTKNPSGHP